MYKYFKDLLNKNDYSLNDNYRIIITNLNSNLTYKIYDIDEKFHHILIDKEIIDNPWTYCYTIQKYENQRWVDSLEKKFFIDFDLLFNILSNKHSVKNLNYFLSEDIKNIPKIMYKIFLSKLFDMINTCIWNDYNATHENMLIFSDFILKNIGYHPYFIVECSIYLQGLVKLKQIIKKYNLNNSWKDYIYKLIHLDDNYSNLIFDFNIIINEYSNYSDKLTSPNIILGKIYDFLGNRDLAIQSYNKAIHLDSFNLILHLGDRYIYTYSKLNDINPNCISSIDSNFKFIYTNIPSSDLVIVSSLDIEYFKKFGPQLLLMCSQLENQHIHMHIIGDSDQCINMINNSILFLESISKINKRKINLPTFSIETLPDNIQDSRAFFACSRFIRCLEIMNHFNKDIYVIDADMIMIDNPYVFFNKIKNYEVVCTISNTLDFFSSWKRISIGNIYFKNNDNVKFFLNIMINYITDNITSKFAWTLDQNAIVYALYYYQLNNIDISLYNAWSLGLPTRQGTIKHIL